MGVYFSSRRLHLLSLAAPLWFCLLSLLIPYMGLQKWTLGCYKTSTQQKPLRCLRANGVGCAADLNHDVFFSVTCFLYNRNDHQSPKCDKKRWSHMVHGPFYLIHVSTKLIRLLLVIFYLPGFLFFSASQISIMDYKCQCISSKWIIMMVMSVYRTVYSSEKSPS